MELSKTEVTSTAYWFLTPFPLLSGNLDVQQRVLDRRSAQVATIEKFLLEIVCLTLFHWRFLLSATLYLPCPYGLARSVVGVHDLSASGPLIDRLLSCSLQRKAAVVCLARAKALCRPLPRTLGLKLVLQQAFQKQSVEPCVRDTSLGCLSVWRVSILTPLPPNDKAVSNSLITFLEKAAEMKLWLLGV